MKNLADVHADVSYDIDPKFDTRQIIQPSLQGDARTQLFARILNRLANLPVPTIEVYKADSAIASVLPYLAYQFAILGYRGWKFVEGDAEQRNLINNAIPMQRLTGSVAGYRKITHLAGGMLHHYIAPPKNTYPGRPWTVAERNAWLALMPKLQTFRFDTRGKKTGFFPGDCFLARDSSPAAKPYPILSDATNRYFEQIYFVTREGIKTQINAYVIEADYSVRDAIVTYRVQKPGRALGVFPVDAIPSDAPRHPGTIDGKYYLIRSDAADRLYSVTLNQPYSEARDRVHKRMIQPNLDQISLNYDYRRVQSTWHSLIAGQIYPGIKSDKHDVLRYSSARERIYKEVHLLDPSVELAPGFRSQAFLGMTRLGMPPFTAELQVERLYTRSRLWMGRFVAGYLQPNNQEPFLDIVRGNNEYRFARDKILLTTKTHDVIRAGLNIKAGTVIAGEIRQFRRT